MINFKSLILKFPFVYENYMNDKWPRNQIRYRTVTGGELVDVRTTLQDTCMEIIELGNTIQGEAKNHDEAALACLRAVMGHVAYKRDIDRNGKAEFWQKPPVTFADGEGDCEDGALLLMTLMDAAGIPVWRRKVCAGYVLDPLTKNKGGHAYVIYLKDDLKWYVLDWCYYAIDCIENYKKGISHSKQTDRYYDIWWTFNQQYCWAQKDTKMVMELAW